MNCRFEIADCKELPHRRGAEDEEKGGRGGKTEAHCSKGLPQRAQRWHRGHGERLAHRRGAENAEAKRKLARSDVAGSAATRANRRSTADELQI